MTGSINASACQDSSAARDRASVSFRAPASLRRSSHATCESARSACCILLAATTPASVSVATSAILSLKSAVSKYFIDRP